MRPARTERVRCADGALLATSVWLPDPQRDSVPAVLVRTPYDMCALADEAAGWVARGYAFVAQDVRGRHGSTGSWEPYTHEERDGLDTAEWIVRQPWSCGRIMLKGGSYQAHGALALAAAGHPAVRAVISAVPAVSHQDVAFGGTDALHLAGCAWWLTSHGVGPDSAPAASASPLARMYRDLRELPVIDLHRKLGVPAPAWQRFLTPASPAPDLGKIPVPVLHIGAWFDPFVAHSLACYSACGSSAATGPPQVLVIGPWDHSLRAAERHGAFRFGDAARYDFGSLEAGWAGQWLQDDRRTGGIDAGRRFFALGANQWLGEAELSSVTQAAWWICADGGLRDRQGAGGTDRYRYDPLHPVPSVLGPVDQHQIEARSDVRCYTTPAFTAGLTVAGQPQVELWASTDAPRTDYIAHLSEVRSDGSSVHLAHGIADGSAGGPGRDQPARQLIRLSPIAIEVPAGHRLRLSVTSSCFPYYARALNTGQDRLRGTATSVARQTIHYGEQHPSRLVLPVLRGRRVL